MNCSRVLHILDSRRGGPVDMAMRICLASSPPLRSFLSNYDDRCSSKRCEPLRPCLSFSNNVAAVATTTAAAEIGGGGGLAWLRRRKKKSVVFADSRGLALTAIHVFNEAEDDPLTELQFHLTEMEGAAARLHLGDGKDAADCGSVLVLDFTQPAADYLDLRNRLKAQQVCLETCSVQERLLDVPCRYLNNVYGCPDTDTFSFSVSVPELHERSKRAEFCIRFQTQDRTFWDNNRGNNYRLTDPNGSPTQSSESAAGLEIQRHRGGEKSEEMEIDPFGSPRTSAGNFPEWQSWGHAETSAPYW